MPNKKFGKIKVESQVIFQNVPCAYREELALGKTNSVKTESQEIAFHTCLMNLIMSRQRAHGLAVWEGRAGP
jgi:hypothetical protein